MKSFFEMLSYMEEERLEAPGGQEVPKEQGAQDSEEGLGNEGSPEVPQDPQVSHTGETKNYMFFSNLKAIKEKVDALLAMDEIELDSMISDGHDWASDHISTSRDDIEEVYNWISGSKEGSAK